MQLAGRDYLGGAPEARYVVIQIGTIKNAIARWNGMADRWVARYDQVFVLRAP